jgi:hypothetical protein
MRENIANGAFYIKTRLHTAGNSDLAGELTTPLRVKAAQMKIAFGVGLA